MLGNVGAQEFVTASLIISNFGAGYQECGECVPGGGGGGGGEVIIIRRKQCYPIWHVENNQWQSGNLERLTPRVLVSAGLPGCGRWVGGGGGWW